MARGAPGVLFACAKSAAMPQYVIERDLPGIQDLSEEGDPATYR